LIGSFFFWSFRFFYPVVHKALKRLFHTSTAFMYLTWLLQLINQLMTVLCSGQEPEEG